MAPDHRRRDAKIAVAIAITLTIAHAVYLTTEVARRLESRFIWSMAFGLIGAASYFLGALYFE